MNSKRTSPRFFLRMILAICLAVSTWVTAVPGTAHAATGVWTSLPDMSAGRFGHTATLIVGGPMDGRVLVSGGKLDITIPGGIIPTGDGNITPQADDETPVAQTAELFDPTTHTWSSTTNLTVPRIFHTATAIGGGKILVAGGKTSDGSVDLSSAEIFDTTSDPPIWTQTQDDMPAPHVSGTATLLQDGRVLVAGGVIGDISSGTVSAKADIYDPITDTWTAAADLHAARAYHTATLLEDGRVLVAGGSDSGFFGSGGNLASAEIYDPSEDTWSEANPLSTARGNHAAVRLPDGGVLVIGGVANVVGEDDDPYLASCELYDVDEGTWVTLSNPLTRARAYLTATLLDHSSQAGKVLVAGGSDSNGFVAGTELYDPTAQIWTDAGVLTDPYGGRSSHTATLLNDGTVLVAGGYLGLDTTNGALGDPTSEFYLPKIPQTISITEDAPASAAYQSTFNVAATAYIGGTTNPSGLIVQYSSGSPTVCEITGLDAGTNTATFTMVSGTGTCVVRFNQSGDDTYDAAPQRTKSVAATKLDQAIQVVTPAPETAVFATTFTVAADATTGLIVAYSSGSPEICEVTGAIFTMLSGTGECKVQYDQSGNNDYAAADRVTQTVTAEKAGQAITFEDPGDYPYGADFTVSAASDSNLQIAFTAGGSDPCQVTDPGFTPGQPAVSHATIHPTDVGTCTITASQDGDDDYTSASEVNRQVEILIADQTITVKTEPQASAPFHGAFTVAAEASSGLSVAYSSADETICSIDAMGLGSMLKSSGTCVIQVDQAGDRHYRPAAQVTREITATKADQAIRFDPIPNTATFGDADIPLTAQSDAGLEVQLTLSPGDACTLNGKLLQIDHAGSCTVTVNQTGDENYSAAVPLSQTISIAKKTVAITLTGLSQTVNGKPMPVLAAPEVSGLTVTITYSGMSDTLYGPTPDAPVQVGSYSVRAEIIHPDYRGLQLGVLTIIPAQLYMPLVANR